MCLRSVFNTQFVFRSFRTCLTDERSFTSPLDARRDQSTASSFCTSIRTRKRTHRSGSTYKWLRQLITSSNFTTSGLFSFVTTFALWIARENLPLGSTPFQVCYHRSSGAPNIMPTLGIPYTRKGWTRTLIMRRMTNRFVFPPLAYFSIR